MQKRDSVKPSLLLIYFLPTERNTMEITATQLLAMERRSRRRGFINGIFTMLLVESLYQAGRKLNAEKVKKQIGDKTEQAFNRVVYGKSEE